MKRIIFKLALVLLPAAFLAGCETWLDVSTDTEVRADDLFESEDGFWEALNGLYINMGSARAYGVSLSWNEIEFMAWQHSTGYNLAAMYSLQRYDWPASHPQSFINTTWQSLYNIISDANYLLYALDTHGSILGDNVRREIKGEALAVRAYCHFDLIRLFAEGDLANNAGALDNPCVPYVTAYGKQLTPQKSYRETLAMLTDDVDNAIGLLDESGITTSSLQTSRANFNHTAVLALRARIAQWANDPKTLQYALDAIRAIEIVGSGSRGWAVDVNNGVAGMFRSELLFYVNHWNLKLFMVNAWESHVEGNTNYGRLANTLDFVNTAIYRHGTAPYGTSESDIRWRTWYSTSSDNNKLSIKVRNEGGNPESIIPLIRMSEPYLIAAEALVATDKGNAVSLVNMLRAKRNVEAVHFVPDEVAADVLRDVIMFEQVRESVQEGQIFFLYKRIGRKQIPGSQAGDMTAARYTLPYPITEQEFGHTNQ